MWKIVIFFALTDYLITLKAIVAPATAVVSYARQIGREWFCVITSTLCTRGNAVCHMICLCSLWWWPWCTYISVIHCCNHKKLKYCSAKLINALPIYHTIIGLFYSIRWICKRYAYIRLFNVRKVTLIVRAWMKTNLCSHCNYFFHISTIWCQVCSGVKIIIKFFENIFTPQKPSIEGRILSKEPRVIRVNILCRESNGRLFGWWAGGLFYLNI